MRITNNMMVNSLMYNLEKNLNRMSKSQKHVNSGKRVNKASDDTIDTAKILKYQTDLSEFGQYEKNVRDALSAYEVTESSVAEVGAVLQRSRELAVQAANGTNTTDDLNKIKEEIDNLIDQLVSTGNFSFAGKYIFSGYQTDKALFNKDGTYNIDITEGDIANPPRMSLLIGNKEKMQTSTSGFDVFGIVKESNAFTSLFTDMSGDQIESNKSAIKGRFDFKAQYYDNLGGAVVDPLDVTIGGVVYDVDETALDGTASELQKGIILERFLNATNGGTPLRDVAKVYFDDNENLVIEAKTPGVVNISTNSTNYKTATLYSGDIATKSTLKGAFTLKGPSADYTAENLDVSIDIGGVPTTFDVDESALNGYALDLTKEAVVQKFRNATDGGGTLLSDVADIYFDQDDNLVIKAREYGAVGINMVAAPAGFTPTAQLGQATQEATLDFAQFTFDDAFVSANQAELKSTPIYLTYNGERKAVELDPTINIVTAAGYHTAVQNAVNKTFGSGKINVTLAGGAPNQYFQFTTVGTTAGQQPELRLEPIKTKKSSLIEDMKAFSAALNVGDEVVIQETLTKLDAHLNRVVSVRADIGAKTSRMELVKNRLAQNEVAFTGMLSEVQDADLAKEIMFLKNAENIYRASLSTGSRVIQPTLMDFLR